MPEPDVNTDALATLFGLTPRLNELMDLGAQQYGFGYARGRVLWALRRSGPVLMRAVSDELGITPRTLTALIDALEADGWVVRRPHPTDRRATLLELTPAAQQQGERMQAAFQNLSHLLFEGVSGQDLQTFQRVLLHVREYLDSAALRAQQALDSQGPVATRRGRPERSARAEHPARSERPARTDRPARTERAPRRGA